MHASTDRSNSTSNSSCSERRQTAGAGVAVAAAVETASQHAWVLAVQALKQEAMLEVLSSSGNILSEILM